MRLKKSDVVCWYPSAMVDFKSILNWTDGRGNKLKPNVFLFTDYSYGGNLINNYEDALVRLRNDFDNIEFTLTLANVISFYNSENIENEVINNGNNIDDNYYHLSPNEYINYLKYANNHGDVIFRSQLFEGQQLWIDDNLDLSGLENIISLGPIAGISGWVKIINTNLTKAEFEGIKVNRIYTNSDINLFQINCEGMACISFGDSKIILMPFSNQELYNCLVNNALKLNCFYAKRTTDNFSYIDTLTSIGVKEAMLGTLTTGEEECLIVRNQDFRYKKLGQPFQAICSINDFNDFVQLYALVEEGVSNRAKSFVERKINDKNNETIKNIVHYLLSERDPSENILDFLKSTVDKDIKTQKAFEYFNILAPITENLDDFIWAITAFTKALFDEEQIESLTLNEAILILKNN
jgi:hypothetical protein